MAMKQALAQRLLRAVEMGHKPEFFNALREKNGKPGVSVRCSCGWVAPSARVMRKHATAVFFWHLEEILQESRQESA